MTAAVGSSEGLSVLHQRLEMHFAALRTRRDQEAGPSFPVFALEHGLTDAELTLLTSTVRQAVQRRNLSRAAWLPYVIYAAEIGYEYSGDEYWQTFTARTPGWADDTWSRDYIRTNFNKFASHFGGARPSGAWAEQFTIICWPITHAVLPTDLQRQLVRLLFEYRSALTSNLLADPPALGARLATRTWDYSSRFQNFAQNTRLLGQVAAALLLGGEGESPYLLNSTLDRIVETLSSQHQERMWLRDARTSASRVRTRGFRPQVSPKRAETLTSADRPRLPAATDPEIVLQQSDHGWETYLRLPDLSVLAERLIEVHDLLAQRRVLVAGSTGAPLAYRRLLMSNQRVRLDEWPDRRTPLLQFEGKGVEAANRLLADQCVLSRGPIWLFRVREPGRAVEVRGKFVRPGHSYVILAPVDSLGDSRPNWVTSVASAATGVSAYEMQVPAILTDQDIEALQVLRLGAISDVEVRPAGVVPGEWDGEGAAEWLAGEEVLLAIKSNHAVAKCVLTVDEDPRYLDWQEFGNEIFVGIADLDVGAHEVQVTLLPLEVDAPVAEGQLIISMRAAYARPSTGTIREGLMLLADPVLPTLSELWDGRAVVELIGPSGAEVTASATLEGTKGRVLARTQFKVHLPLEPGVWLRTASKELQGSPVLQPCYDEADVLNLTFSHPALGKAQLRCERELAPLRWVVGHDRDGPYARLVNNVESRAIELLRYAYASPANPEPVSDSSEERLRWPAGGLLLARVEGFQSAVILPPYVRHLGDIRISPYVANAPRTIDRMLELIRLSALWAGASLTGHPFAQHDRRVALRALTMRLVALLAGGRWAQLEEHGLPDDQYSFRQLQEGLGDETYQKALAEAIQRRIVGWIALEPPKPRRRVCGRRGHLSTSDDGPTHRASVRRVPAATGQ